MPPELVVVDQFQGMRRGLRTGFRSERRELDTPRDLRNAIIDENGSLWIPPGPDEEIHSFTFSGADRLTTIVNITTPNTAILYQVANQLYYLRTDSGSSGNMESLLDVETDYPIWVIEFGENLYIGTEDKTWKVDDSWSATELSSDIPAGFHSYMYKGRRFVVVRNNRVYFSDLNEPENFGEESWFIVGGDDSGGSWATNPGSVTCLAEYDDYLVIFCTQSIWLFMGTTVDTFQLRRTNSLAGAWSRDSVVRVEGGILFFGGTPRGEMGVYMFGGGQANLVSDAVSAFFRRWDQVGRFQQDEDNFEQATKFIHAVRWNDNYILSGETLRTTNMQAGDERQVFMYNFRTNTWTTFDGWMDGPRIALARLHPNTDALHVSKDNVVYSTQEAFCRAPGERARVLLGWSDHGHPAGHHRFLGVKLSGWRTSYDAPPPATVTLTATTPEGVQVSDTRDIDTAVFDNLVFGLNLRGNAIDLEFIFEFDETDGDDTQLIIEQVQLIRSTKGEKLSRT